MAYPLAKCSRPAENPLQVAPRGIISLMNEAHVGAHVYSPRRTGAHTQSLLGEPAGHTETVNTSHKILSATWQ